MRVLQKIYKIYRDAYNTREYHTCLTHESEFNWLVVDDNEC